MRTLMISIDRSLLDARASGDVLERHQEYARRSGRLDIIVFSKDGFSRKKVGENLRIYPTNSSSKVHYLFDAYEIAKNIYWPDKFDLVVSQDPLLTGLVGWLVRRRFNVPLLIDFHGDFWGNRYWLKERWYNFILLLMSRFLTRKADGLRVVSSGIREKLVQAGIPKKKIRVIPTPVDVGKFMNYDALKVARLRQRHRHRKTIINAGLRDYQAKDYPTLFKAIGLVYEKYRNLTFWQVGAGLNLGEKIKAEENLMLISQGKTSQERLINYYHASDVYVSSSKHESLGKVLIEAMAAGLPVVATKTTGSKEIVKDGESGFLVPIGDSQALARKILYLLNNPDKAQAMGKTGRRIVEKKFGQEKIIKAVINFWQDLCV